MVHNGLVAYRTPAYRICYTTGGRHPLETGSYPPLSVSRELVNQGVNVVRNGVQVQTMNLDLPR